MAIKARLRHIITLRAIAVAILCLIASLGWADCSTPTGVAGQIHYSGNYKVMQFCDGTDWVNLGSTNQGGNNGSCSAPAGAEGAIFYNTNTNVLEYCNGNVWINMGNASSGSPGCTNPAASPGKIVFNSSNKRLMYCNGTEWVNAGGWTLDTDPDSFGFTNLTDQNLSTQVTSNIIQIAGLGGSAPVTASGASAQVRVCADAACTTVLSTWSGSANIGNGQYLQARQTTSGSYNTTTTGNINVGTIATTWTAATLLAPCGTQSVTWSSCSGTLGSTLASGSSTLITNTAANYTGSVTVTCTDGTLDHSSPSCASLVVPGSQDYTTAGSYTFTVPAFNTLTVQVWGGGGGAGGRGAGGNAGSASSFSGVSGAAGTGGGANMSGGTSIGGAGGTATGGDTNTTGSAGSNTSTFAGANGGNSPNGGTGGAGTGTANGNGSAGNPPGGGGGGGGGAGAAARGGGGGGGGAYASKTYSAGQFSVGSQITVSVGAGGTGGTTGFGTGGTGGTGRVYIQWQ